ncbi:AAA family ATPase [Alphaproteobacteria bacterium]|nr:AAA family ATPase [Alphaproteobacteria bacterium]
MNKIESIKKENLNEINNVSSANLFGIKTDLEVPQFIKRGDHCPPIDKNYVFDDDTTVAILLGLKFNKRVFLQGLHGTGKSSHIEQVCARLNWPCIRINLDSHVSRIDLIGKDSIILKEGKQVTEFQEGILPWAFQNNVALVFDEYDAGRPDVMFVIQRVLENEGKLTLLDQNKVLTPHPFFRIFATANTVGLGDTSGIYHGTNQINQGQMDRWNIVAKLNYLDEEKEIEIIAKKIAANTEEKKLIKFMVQMANLTRKGFEQKNVSIVMSPRTVIMWAENYKLINNIQKSLAMTFLNKCDESEIDIYKEYFQRAFGEDF